MLSSPSKCKCAHCLDDLSNPRIVFLAAVCPNLPLCDVCYGILRRTRAKRTCSRCNALIHLPTKKELRLIAVDEGVEAISASMAKLTVCAGACCLFCSVECRLSHSMVGSRTKSVCFLCGCDKTKMGMALCARCAENGEKKPEKTPISRAKDDIGFQGMNLSVVVLCLRCRVPLKAEWREMLCARMPGVQICLPCIQKLDPVPPCSTYGCGLGVSLAKTLNNEESSALSCRKGCCLICGPECIGFSSNARGPTCLTCCCSDNISSGSTRCFTCAASVLRQSLAAVAVVAEDVGEEESSEEDEDLPKPRPTRKCSYCHALEGSRRPHTLSVCRECDALACTSCMGNHFADKHPRRMCSASLCTKVIRAAEGSECSGCHQCFFCSLGCLQEYTDEAEALGGVYWRRCVGLVDPEKKPRKVDAPPREPAELICSCPAKQPARICRLCGFHRCDECMHEHYHVQHRANTLQVCSGSACRRVLTDVDEPLRLMCECPCTLFCSRECSRTVVAAIELSEVRAFHPCGCKLTCERCPLIAQAEAAESCASRVVAGLQLGSSAVPASPPGSAPILAAPNGVKAGEDDRMCKVCFSLPASHAALNCGHVATCDGCTESCYGSVSKLAKRVCIVCRKPVVKTIKLFFA
jgi:hypothetical protein